MTIPVFRTFRQTSSKYSERLLKVPASLQSFIFIILLVPSSVWKKISWVGFSEGNLSRQTARLRGPRTKLYCCWILITNSWFNLSTRRMLSSLSCLTSQYLSILTISHWGRPVLLLPSGQFWPTKNKLTRRQLCVFPVKPSWQTASQPGCQVLQLSRVHGQGTFLRIRWHSVKWSESFLVWEDNQTPS